MSRQHPRAAPTKTTPPFQTLEAALPPGMVQAADPVARKVLISRNWRHLVQFRGTLDGPHGGIVRFGCNLSRVGRGLYFAYVRGRRAKRAPNIAIPPCDRPYLHVYPTSLFLPSIFPFPSFLFLPSFPSSVFFPPFPPAFSAPAPFPLTDP